MKLYNTLTRKVETFKAIEEGKVGLYACGPTVYYYAHIGNMLPYVFWDILKRTLTRDGYKVKYVMNITDVGHLVSDSDVGEDKMRVAMEREHKSPLEIADFYTKKFKMDVKRLNIEEPNVLPKATDHIPQMLSLIEKLDKKEFLYKISGAEGGMYFDTSMFKEYGILTGHNFDELNKMQQAGARVGRPDGLRNVTDFAVWRFTSPSIKDMVWDTPYGKGFPGWHIECSAMSMMYLGEHFDIHGGGIDHIPIHHTNEIAQSEAATGKKFVNYWIHSNHMLVDGKKMSKSLKNIYTVQDLIDKGFSSISYRYFLATNHYRSQLNFTFEALKHAEETLKSLYVFVSKTSALQPTGKTDPMFIKRLDELHAEFFESINDDLNVPVALSKLHELVNATSHRASKLGKEEVSKVLKIILDFDSVLGLRFEEHLSSALPQDAKKLIELREQVRAAKDFKKADELREKLKTEFKISVEDTKEGTLWYTSS